MARRMFAGRISPLGRVGLRRRGLRGLRGGRNRRVSRLDRLLEASVAGLRGTRVCMRSGFLSRDGFCELVGCP